MLIGRGAELRQLEGHLADSRPVAVYGEAGVGKTALVREAAVRTGRRLREAGALATLSWWPYFPARRALGREPIGADPAYVALELESDLSGDVLFLDDLHWADPQTRELLPFLAGRMGLAVTVRVADPGGIDIRETLDDLGFASLDLTPLTEEEAFELVRSMRPGMTESGVARVVGRSAGLPLLLEELSVLGEPSESLEHALAARARALPEDVRDGTALLALAGRPLARDELAAAGILEKLDLIREQGGGLEVRHPLLAAALVAGLSERERRALHRRLARMADHPGEAARHLAAAGDRAAALRSALVAAESASLPGEVASHLEVAASVATGADADELRVRAAAALTEAARYAAAERLLDGVAGAGSPLDADVCLLRAKAAAEVTDVDSARRLIDRGLDVTRGSGSATELALRLERLELDLSGEDLHGHVAAARSLLRLARRGGHETAHAHFLLARALREAGSSEWEERMHDAMSVARAEDRVAIELRASELYLAYLFHDGNGRRAIRFASERSMRASTLKLASWQRRFRMRRAWLLLHAGRFRATIDECEELLGQPLEAWERFMVLYCAAEAASDLGLFERADELVAELLLEATGPQRLSQAQWTLADVSLWAGRPGDAERAAREALAGYTHIGSPLIHVALAWACFELGREHAPPSVDPATQRMLLGAWPELEAVRLLATGQFDGAAARFADAEALWRGQHARGRLRCAWARGESFRLGGRRGEALEALLRAERLALAYQHAPLASRVHRSLRLVGMKRSAARAAGAHGLTAREQELLALVALGLSNAEIARRLGISRPTVSRTLRSAAQKLGAETRSQAAAIVTQ